MTPFEIYQAQQKKIDEKFGRGIHYSRMDDDFEIKPNWKHKCISRCKGGKANKLSVKTVQQFHQSSTLALLEGLRDQTECRYNKELINDLISAIRKE